MVTRQQGIRHQRDLSPIKATNQLKEDKEQALFLLINHRLNNNDDFNY